MGSGGGPARAQSCKASLSWAPHPKGLALCCSQPCHRKSEPHEAQMSTALGQVTGDLWLQARLQHHCPCLPIQGPKAQPCLSQAMPGNLAQSSWARLQIHSDLPHAGEPAPAPHASPSRPSQASYRVGGIFIPSNPQHSPSASVLAPPLQMKKLRPRVVKGQSEEGALLV